MSPLRCPPWADSPSGATLQGRLNVVFPQGLDRFSGSREARKPPEDPAMVALMFKTLMTDRESAGAGCGSAGRGDTMGMPPRQTEQLMQMS